jgi:hypothetical protein
MSAAAEGRRNIPLGFVAKRVAAATGSRPSSIVRTTNGAFDSNEIEQLRVQVTVGAGRAMTRSAI